MRIIMALLLVIFAAAIPLSAQTQVQVFVPGNATGAFGHPVDIVVPFVPAITVTSPATITVTYDSGTIVWTAGGEPTGPNGAVCENCVAQSPLQEGRALGRAPKPDKMAALIGVFVPAARAGDPQFKAVDGTKNIAHLGILPGSLFFIGENETLDVKEAGTLFLGINDWASADNVGGFNVTVTGP